MESMLKSSVPSEDVSKKMALAEELAARLQVQTQAAEELRAQVAVAITN
jgi:hypothetical protein